MSPAWERRRGKVHFFDAVPRSMRWRFMIYAGMLLYGAVMYLLGDL